MMKYRKTFHEILAEADAATTRDDKVGVLRKYGGDGDHLKYLLNLTFHPKIKWLLPPGIPPFKESKEEESALVPRLVQELKRLPNFLNVGPYPNMAAGKLESLFISMLESLDPQDAILLCHMKDGIIPFESLTRDLIVEAFPDLGGKWEREDPNKK